jgi:gliding motility-associated-like protein
MTKYIFSLLIICAIGVLNAQSISTNQMINPYQLVNNVLLKNSCTSISNVVVSGFSVSGTDNSFGYFNKNGSIFPFQEGIVLSTGKLSALMGPNSNFSDDSFTIGWPGDTDLNNALSLSNTFNATYLEFDFVPAFNSISFEYIFASEQYLSNPSPNQCNFTDGFAFLIKPVGSATYQNIALVPGTNTAVKVNTVRGSGTACPAANDAYFDAFNTGNYPTAFDGQTKALIAQSAVIPGQTYHIKLVIADEGNARFDSAIFLKGGSFTSEIDLGSDRLISNNNPRCTNEVITLNATTIGATNYNWFKNGNLLPTETNPTLIVNDSGTYAVEATVGSCIVPGEIIIENQAVLNLNVANYFLCENNSDGFATFDLNEIRNNLFTNLPANHTILFTDTSGNPLINSNNQYINNLAFYETIYAVVPQTGSCDGNYPISLNVFDFNNVYPIENVGICNNSSTSLTAPAGFVNYEWSTTPTQNTQTINTSTPGTYSVTFTDSNGCEANKIFLVTNSNEATINSVEVNDFDENLFATINVSGLGDYVYSLNNVNFQESNVIILPDAGEYEVFVKDLKGCGTSMVAFYALNYPQFFTPNGDGYNDFWQIANLDKRGLESNIISIYDKFGKLVKQISGNGIGWNGNFNNQPLPSSDYWFVINLSNNKTVKGHFSLKR